MSTAGWSRASGWCTARARWRSPPTRGCRAGPWAPPAAPRSSGPTTEAVSRGVPIVGLWHSGGARLAEGVASLHAVGTVFAAMTARLRAGAADLRGARACGRRRRLRPGADRHRDPVRPGPHLRHRPGRGALGDRRGRGRRAARRARAAQPPLRRRARGDRDRRRGAGPGPRDRGAAQRPGQDRRGRRGPRPVRAAARVRPPRLRRARADRASCSTRRAWSCTPAGRRTS